jgi:hypothetical protein
MPAAVRSGDSIAPNWLCCFPSHGEQKSRGASAEYELCIQQSRQSLSLADDFNKAAETDTTDVLVRSEGYSRVWMG